MCVCATLVGQSGLDVLNRKRVEKIEQIYNAIAYLREASIEKLQEILNIPRRTLYYHLSWMVSMGLVEKSRKGSRVVYRVAKPLNWEELVSESTIPENEPEVYKYAMRIQRLINRYRLRADFVGACKIHFAVPDHNRVTWDVDVVVVREDANLLVRLLKDIYGFRTAMVDIPPLDYKLASHDRTVYVDIYIDGFKKRSGPIWSLRRPLLRHGHLLLEHAIVGKFIKPVVAFIDKNDAYDIIVSLPHVNIKVLSSILDEALRLEPDNLKNAIPNIEATLRFAKEEFRDKYMFVKKLLHRIVENTWMLQREGFKI